MNLMENENAYAEIFIDAYQTTIAPIGSAKGQYLSPITAQVKATTDVKISFLKSNPISLHPWELFE